MLIALLACSTPAVDAAPPVTPPAADATVTTEGLGAKVFAERCAICHGEGGKGDGPAAVGLTPKPKDISRPRLPEERKPPSRMEIVRTGVPGTAMPGFATVLTAAELDAVITHIQTLAHEGAAPGMGMGHGPGMGGG